jgi:hypothetical protein
VYRCGTVFIRIGGSIEACSSTMNGNPLAILYSILLSRDHVRDNDWSGFASLDLVWELP